MPCSVCISSAHSSSEDSEAYGLDWSLVFHTVLSNVLASARQHSDHKQRLEQARVGSCYFSY